MTKPAAMIRNALTIDVEDYFQVSAFAPLIERQSWLTYECRIERNVNRILQLLDDRQIKATFFTLGWIAERYPLLVRTIVTEGHELASHGYSHCRASEQTKVEFFEDVQHAKNLLEALSGSEVIGYRAPSFSIGAANWWAFDSLLKAGYRYSSSVYPVRHDHYGMVNAPRFAFDTGEGLIEFPLSTCCLLTMNMPASGGGYFRFFPYQFSRWMLQRINRDTHQPAIFYFHPWEIDSGQPRIQGINAKTKFRHYFNLAGMEARLKMLFSDFSWGRMDHVFQDRLHQHVKA